jgi:hypothetical protein
MCCSSKGNPPNTNFSSGVVCKSKKGLTKHETIEINKKLLEESEFQNIVPKPNVWTISADGTEFKDVDGTVVRLAKSISMRDGYVGLSNTALNSAVISSPTSITSVCEKQITQIVDEQQLMAAKYLTYQSANTTDFLESFSVHSEAILVKAHKLRMSDLHQQYDEQIAEDVIKNTKDCPCNLIIVPAEIPLEIEAEEGSRILLSFDDDELSSSATPTVLGLSPEGDHDQKQMEELNQTNISRQQTGPSHRRGADQFISSIINQEAQKNLAATSVLSVVNETEPLQLATEDRNGLDLKDMSTQETSMSSASEIGSKFQPSESLSILDTLKARCPLDVLQTKYRAGITAFNAHHQYVGRERLQNLASKKIQDVEYSISTFHDLIPQGRCRNKIWERTDQFLLDLSFKAVHSKYPTDLWAMGSVTGDGNCFEHSISVYSAIVEPTWTDLHYYHQIRQLLADTLLDHKDDPTTPGNAELDMLEYFQLQDVADVNKTEGFEATMLDIAGRSPPTRIVDQSDDEFAAAQDQYQAFWTSNRAIVMERFLKVVEDSRAMGAYNSGMEILSLALLTKKQVDVFLYSKKEVCFRSSHVITPPGWDGRSVIPLFHDPTPDYEHYTVAVPLENVADYKAPMTAPKNSATHDEQGALRAAYMTDGMLWPEAKKVKGSTTERSPEWFKKIKAT